MTDLAAFILARIAEDEEAARAATAGPWLAATPSGPKRRKQQYSVLGVESLRGQGEKGALAVFAGLNQHRADDAEHAARHDPARMLAQCTALRAVVESYVEREEDSEAVRDPDYWDVPIVLEHLASIWAEHPDYDPAWRLA